MTNAEIEISPMRGLFIPAVELAIMLDHPAYDCLYLALAAAQGCPLVTADERFLRKVAASREAGLAQVLTLAEAARLVATG